MIRSVSPVQLRFDDASRLQIKLQSLLRLFNITCIHKLKFTSLYPFTHTDWLLPLHPIATTQWEHTENYTNPYRNSKQIYTSSMALYNLVFWLICALSIPTATSRSIVVLGIWESASACGREARLSAWKVRLRRAIRRIDIARIGHP